MRGSTQLVRAIGGSIVAAACLTSPSLAHISEPSTARGFSADQVYQLNGLDSVNLFNGNLNVTLPIGPSYPVGGGLSYQLKLVYNSQIWDFEHDTLCVVFLGAVGSTNHNNLGVLGGLPAEYFENDQQQCYTVAIPNRKSNAGTGWSLSLGELYAPGEEGGGNVNAWVYASPDGAEHTFFPSLHGEAPDDSFFYTRDGSFLRLAPNDSFVEVHSPDGIVHTFKEHVHPVSETDSTPGPETHWRLTRMEDPFGNYVKVDYVGAGNTDLAWEITDSSSSSRKHRVVLTEDEIFKKIGGALQRRERHVDYVDLAGPAGTRSIYDFRYGGEPEGQHAKEGAYWRSTVTRGCPNDWQGLNGAVNERKTDLIQLRALVLPDKSTFGMTYRLPESTDTLCSLRTGKLVELRLPTGGALEYEYGGYPTPRNSCNLARFDKHSGRMPRKGFFFSNTSGIVQRSERDGRGTTATWKYLRYFGGDWGVPSQTRCDLPKTVVTAVLEPTFVNREGEPRQKTTLNYFSIYQPGQGGLGNQELDENGQLEEGYAELGWSAQDYGLPFTRESIDFGKHLPDDARDPADPERRFISREVYDCLATPNRNAEVPDPLAEVHTPFTGFSLAGCALQRQVFVGYERDSIGCIGNPEDDGNPDPNCIQLDRRVASEATHFVDDPFCTVAGKTNQPCVEEVNRDRYDGLGHYRLVRSVGKFNGIALERTVETEFNPDADFDPGFPASFTRPAFVRWILGTYEARTTSQSGPHGKSSFEAFDFDAATGFLLRHERHRGAGLGSLVTAYTKYPSGNLQFERHSGGDDGNGSKHDYVIGHEHSFGVLSGSEYRDPDQEGTTLLRFAHHTIDPATGLVSASRDPSGVWTNFGYDSMWRLKSVAPQDQRDAETEYQYLPFDGRSARVRALTRRRTGSAGGLSSVAAASVAGYCANKLGTVAPDVLTHQEYEYDGLGRVVRTRSWMPDMVAEVATAYTPQGWVALRTTPYDACTNDQNDLEHPATRTAYDMFGRPAKVTAPDHSAGNDRFTTYDYAGERVVDRKVFGLGADGKGTTTTRLNYDHLRRLVEVKEPTAADGGNTVWKYDYDQGDRLVQVRVPGQQARTFGYDLAGLLRSESHPELAEVTINYCGHDARGHARRMAYGSCSPPPAITGTAFDLERSFDRAGRPVRVGQITTGKPLTELFYGTSGLATGKLVRSKRHNYLPLGADEVEVDVVVSELNEYNGPSGRLSTHRLVTGGSGSLPRVSFETAYEYDSLGNASRVSYPGCGAAWCFDIFEDGQRVAEADVDPHRDASYAYQWGLLSAVSSRSSATAAAGRQLATLGYHRDGLLARVSHSNGVTETIADDPKAMGRPLSISAGALWSSGNYGYDGAGNISKIGADTFVYDKVHRLVSATMTNSQGGASRSQAFTYDEYGNMKTYAGTDLGVNAATNRINGWTYDTAGNANTTADGYFYSFDALGAMARAYKSSGTPDRMHLYDADGERIAVLHRVDGKTERELWSLRGAGASVLRDVEYIPKKTIMPDPGLVISTGGWRWLQDYVNRGSGLLASFKPDQLGGEVERRYHLDHLGSPRAISDAAGAPVARHKYLPFGEEIDPPSDITSERMKFTGHERDDLGPGTGQLSDLDYMHARYYRPLAARLLSLDPVLGVPTNPQSWNRYAYLLNNPVVATDPTGMRREQPSPGTLAELSSCGYPANRCGDHVDGFTRVRGYSGAEDTGITATLWHNEDTGAYVLVYAGTDEFVGQGSDLDDNGGQAFGLDTGQYADARRISEMALRTVREETGSNAPNLTFTGHSLGGGLAAASSMQTGLRAVTFNAAGVGPSTGRRMGLNQGWNYSAAITNYYVPGDVLSTSQSLLRMLIPNAVGRQVRLTPPPGGGPFARHGIRTVCASLGRSCGGNGGW